MSADVILTGQSGRTYLFTCYSPQTNWNTVAGCYAFAARTSNPSGVSVTRILYIGQTESFQRRMAEHQDDKWAAVARHGANLVLAASVPNEDARLAMEQDLIRHYQPHLNDQHVQQDRQARWPEPPRNSLLDL